MLACPICGGGGVTELKGVVDGIYGRPGAWDVIRCQSADCATLWLDPRPASDAALYSDCCEYATHRAGVYKRSGLPEFVFRLKCGYLLRDRRAVSPAYRGLGRLAAWLSPAFRTSAARVGFFLGAPEQGCARLLDLGCGGGASMLDLQELGWEVEGVDFDASAVQHARSQGLAARVGTLEEQGFAAESFDAVVLNHVIEHVAEPIALLKAVRRVLKPGGRAVITTPNSRSFLLKEFGRNWHLLGAPEHLHLFAPRGMEALGLRAGFARARAITTNCNAAATILGSRALQAGHGGRTPGMRKAFFRRLLTGIAWARRVAACGAEEGDEIVLLADCAVGGRELASGSGRVVWSALSVARSADSDRRALAQGPTL